MFTGGFRSLIAEVGACFMPNVELYSYASWLVLVQLYWLFSALMPPEFPIGRLKALKFSYLKANKAFCQPLMRDVCCLLRVSLSKKCRLAAKLEALGEQGDAVRALENMKEIVARDSVMLADL
ncbi:hypothetical protein Tco_1005072 [Tanacetum coccineum]|uniref:Uncharacterized protein n=1 Tax=Tanacetum coccineum TaxID=301880 RepID=A0ABQ5FEP0_9ASTR